MTPRGTKGDLGSNRRRRVEDFGLEPGQWHRELVGRINGYPKSRAAYEARAATLAGYTDRARKAGRLKRTGVPNGWAGKKGEVAALRRNAVRASEKLVERLDTPVETDDDALGRLAIATGLSIALGSGLN